MEGLIAKWYAKNTGRAPEQKVIFNKVKSTLPPHANIWKWHLGRDFFPLNSPRPVIQ